MLAERRRARGGGLPVLAMVDAFVGAISVILILVLVVDPTSDRLDLSPKATLVVTCADDITSVAIYRVDSEGRREVVAEGVAFEAVPGRLALEAPAAAMSQRVVIEGPPRHARCMGRIADDMALANRNGMTTELFNAAAQGFPVFITDEHFVILAEESQ